MEKTKNLGLWLPEDTDLLEVSKLSENFEDLDRAFADVAAPFKIGDILSTLRTDLGDDWLLCNGEPLDAAKYPELSGVLPGLSAMASAATVSSAAQGLIPSGGWPIFSATDGVNQVVTTANNSITTAQINYAIWSSDDFKTASRKSIGSCCVARPFYCNGRWILFAFSYNSSVLVLDKISVAAAPAAAFGDDATPPETTINDVMGVEYTGGKYYAFVRIGTRCAVLTSDSPNFSGASVTYVNTANNNGQYANYCKAGDKYVFVRFNPTFYDVSWSDSPASGYQTRTLTTQSSTVTITGLSGQYGMTREPAYQNGKLFWIASSYETPRKGVLVCLDGIESGNVKYTALDIVSGIYSYHLVNASGKELAFFYYETSGSTTTVYLVVSDGDPTNASNWKKTALTVSGSVFYYRDALVQSNSAIGLFVSGNKLISVPFSAVPKISISNCYTYIKAK